MWRLTPRDRVTLDAWENIAGGLYRAATLPVHQAGQHIPALVYIARDRPPGQPRAGYMEVVAEAARAWNCPPTTLLPWKNGCPRGPPSVRPPKTWRFLLSTHRHVIVRGRVQGVGYRAWTEYDGARARLCKAGSATAATARVEAVFAGPEDAVAA